MEALPLLLIWWGIGAIVALGFTGWAIVRAPIRITIWLALMGLLVWWAWGTPFIAIAATLWPLTMVFLMLIPWGIFIRSLTRGAPDVQYGPQVQAQPAPQAQPEPYWCDYNCWWDEAGVLHAHRDCRQHN